MFLQKKPMYTNVYTRKSKSKERLKEEKSIKK